MYIRSSITWSCQAPAQKIKKIRPEKNSLYFKQWKFLNLRLKNFFFFLKRKLFLYFRKWNPAFFSSSLKNKKNPPQENFLYSGKIELSNCRIKKFLIFSRNKAFHYFDKRKPRKNFLYFLERNIFLYFRKWKPRRKFLIYKETELFYI